MKQLLFGGGIFIETVCNYRPGTRDLHETITEVSQVPPCLLFYIFYLRILMLYMYRLNHTGVSPVPRLRNYTLWPYRKFVDPGATNFCIVCGG